jgi:hypothetical protein
MLNAKEYFEMMLTLFSDDHEENLAMIKVWASKITDEMVVLQKSAQKLLEENV